MTERTLRLPLNGADAPTLHAIPAARTAARAAAASRGPLHVAVAVGVTAGLYAVSLAGVTALQAGTDARLSAERAPSAAAVEALRTNHDQADAAMARIEAAYVGAAAAYQRVADEIASHEASLAALGKRVDAVEGSAAALRVPTVSRLPSVSSRTVYVARPATNACTTASGSPC